MYTRRDACSPKRHYKRKSVFPHRGVKTCHRWEKAWTEFTLNPHCSFLADRGECCCVPSPPCKLQITFWIRLTIGQALSLQQYRLCTFRRASKEFSLFDLFSAANVRSLWIDSFFVFSFFCFVLFQFRGADAKKRWTSNWLVRLGKRFDVVGTLNRNPYEFIRCSLYSLLEYDVLGVKARRKGIISLLERKSWQTSATDNGGGNQQN